MHNETDNSAHLQKRTLLGPDKTQQRLLGGMLRRGGRNGMGKE